MNDRLRKLLFDVLDSATTIVGWCQDRTYAEYEDDRRLRRAVEREFEIIGEALSRLSQADPSTAGRIQALPRIIAFRNRIAHGYDAVDNAAVWGIINSRLPQLILEIKDISEPPE
jgi:uncharacterized protein with HEPN domain